MKIRETIIKLRNGFGIAEKITLGLDIGIASCGWAVIDNKNKKILGAGTWGFEVSEVAKTRESKAAVRRVARGQRRRLRRRRQRMREMRKLLHENGLLSSALPAKDEKGVAKPSLNPWELRAQGLDRLLTGEEFATVLIHIAKHRGYRSNSKSDRASNAPIEDKKVLSGLASIEGKSGKYRTVGEMFAQDPEFADKKRNRDGDYSHTVLRKLHEEEVSALFRCQRKFGSAMAMADMEEAYASLAFDQLPLQDSEVMLGKCPFEPDEKRASSLAYSFEKFRYLSKLANIRVDDGSRSGRRLTPEELSKAVNGFGKTAKAISWKRLIALTGLAKDTRFIGVGDKDMGRDVARNSKGCAFGSYTLYRIIGEAAWNSLVQSPEKLDDIAHVLTFREDVGRIEKGLRELQLEPAIFDAIIRGVDEGGFAGFAKAGHISTKAVRLIIPGLLQGNFYSESCELAGYDHTKENPANFESMTNPVAKRAITETLKQVNVLVRHLGLRPDQIHIEMGRDVGKGPEERGKIEKGIKDRTAAKEKARAAFCELVEKADCSFGELQRYELWKEQGHKCMFCDDYINPEDLCDGRHVCEIEHILPLSRSHDNSWHNKVLACVKCNRDKGDKTPYEWFGEDAARWDEFEFRVKALKADGKIKGFKIRNLLMRDYEEREQGFIERNKNDMRYAARVILSELKLLYSDQEFSDRRRLYSRPGQITSILRRLWGLDRFKYLPKEGKQERIDDERHHAVDAMVVAAASESLLQRLIRAMQEREDKGLPPLKLRDFKQPWPDFSRQVEAARDIAPVARGENRRARGAGHAATIRQIRVEDDKRIAYERVAVDKLSQAKLERMKDPDRNQDTIDALSKWITAGKPADKPPRRNNGFVIRKVTLRSEKNPTTQRAGFEAHGGLVDNADMVRVDVFEKDRKFHLVPVYAHQVADREHWPQPPDRAIPSKTTPEHDWLRVDNSYSFKFSLYPYSWVQTVKRDGVVVEGYYRGSDRSTGAINLSEEHSRQRLIRGIGVKTLHSFKKFQVDRLGNKNEIKSEVRTWHGVACT